MLGLFFNSSAFPKQKRGSFLNKKYHFTNLNKLGLDATHKPPCVIRTSKTKKSFLYLLHMFKFKTAPLDNKVFVREHSFKLFNILQKMQSSVAEFNRPLVASLCQSAKKSQMGKLLMRLSQKAD